MTFSNDESNSHNNPCEKDSTEYWFSYLLIGCDSMINEALSLKKDYDVKIWEKGKKFPNGNIVNETRILISLKSTDNWEIITSSLDDLHNDISKLNRSAIKMIEFTIHCMPLYSSSKYQIGSSQLKPATEIADKINFSHTIVDIDRSE